MKYAVNIKFIELDGKISEKSLPTNNIRSGNLLFDTHKAYQETIAVKLVEKQTDEVLRTWKRV